MLVRLVVASYFITIARLLDFSVTFTLYTYNNCTVLNIIIIYKKKKFL